MVRGSTFAEFWSEYLDLHQHRQTRLLHFVGTSVGLLSVPLAVLTWQWQYLMAGIIITYGLAGYGHLAVERNLPGSVRHPIWALRASLTLYRLMLTRGLSVEIRMLKS